MPRVIEIRAATPQNQYRQDQPQGSGFGGRTFARGFGVMATRRLKSQTKTSSEESLLPPRFAEFFTRRGWTPRQHQLALLKHAEAGGDVLLIAPTGAGKTLAGFLPTLIDLDRPRNRRGLHTLYLSPLKALATDVARNLEIPHRRDGPQHPGGDAYRRYIDVEAPAPTPRSARHPPDDAEQTRTSAGQCRRTLSFSLTSSASSLMNCIR